LLLSPLRLSWPWRSTGPYWCGLTPWRKRARRHRSRYPPSLYMDTRS